MRVHDASRRETAGKVTSLVLPAYNPGSSLDQTLDSIESFLSGADRAWEILFVCDGSTDGSIERMESFAARTGGQVRVVSYAPNRGKGYAVRRGFAEAKGDWVLFTDIDLAYGWSDILRVADVLREGADVAIASRTHPESRIQLPPGLLKYVYRRQVQSDIFSRIVRMILPISHRDTQAGLKGISAAALRKILPRLRSTGFEFDCELLTACARHHLTIQEVPVCVRYEEAASTTSTLSSLQMVRALLAIRRRWPAQEPSRTTVEPVLESIREAA